MEWPSTFTHEKWAMTVHFGSKENPLWPSTLDQKTVQFRSRRSVFAPSLTSRTAQFHYIRPSTLDQTHILKCPKMSIFTKVALNNCNDGGISVALLSVLLQSLNPRVLKLSPSEVREFRFRLWKKKFWRFFMFFETELNFLVWIGRVETVVN